MSDFTRPILVSRCFDDVKDIDVNDIGIVKSTDLGCSSKYTNEKFVD